MNGNTDLMVTNSFFWLLAVIPQTYMPLENETLESTVALVFMTEKNLQKQSLCKGRNQGLFGLIQNAKIL